MMQKKEQDVYFFSRVIIAKIIFVTKNIIFQEWASKKIFDLHVSCRLGRVMQYQHIFKSGPKD